LKLLPCVGATGTSIRVAFTPKGGCPLKQIRVVYRQPASFGNVAFTPKGGCPLKHQYHRGGSHDHKAAVAFTPKGGCPLKLRARSWTERDRNGSSIHPQGWVPIETSACACRCYRLDCVAFTPKGRCPLKRNWC